MNLAEQQEHERVAKYLRERADERRLEQGRKAARSGPDAAQLQELEQRRDRLYQEQLALMKEALEERRTLDSEEAAIYDAIKAERADLAAQIARLQAKYMPPLP